MQKKNSKASHSAFFNMKSLIWKKNYLSIEDKFELHQPLEKFGGSIKS